MVRFKNRWLLVEFIPVRDGVAQIYGTSSGTGTGTGTSASLDGKRIWNALKECVLHNFGDTGWGALSLSLTVKYYSPMTNICIVRVARDQHKLAWGAVTLLTSVEGARYVPNVIHVSGTIKHAQLAAIAHNRDVVARNRAHSKLPTTYQDSYDAYLEKSTAEIEALQD